jgi:6-phosphofructokinase 1
MEPSGQRDAIRKMNEAGMDALIVIGGEGSMNGANALSQKGIKVIGIPASIDNDIWGTNIAIGTDTAMNTIMEAVDKLRDTASSHQRAFLIETMGRNSGYLAVMTAIVCGAEVALIPEVPITADEVAVVVEEAYKRGKTHALSLTQVRIPHRSRQGSMIWMWDSKPHDHSRSHPARRLTNRVRSPAGLAHGREGCRGIGGRSAWRDDRPARQRH